VISTASADFAAANLIELAADRGIYAHIVDDVGQMLEHAQEVASTWTLPEGIEGEVPERAFTVQSLACDYVAPTGSDGRPRIDVSLEVKTTHPDATRFVVESLDRWLTDHTEREGVPYRIVMPEGTAWRLVSESVVGESETVAQGPGRRSPMVDPIGRGGRRPGSRGIVDQFEGEFQGPVTFTGAPQPPTRRGPAQSSQELERLAPLPEAPPDASPGTKVSSFRVIWSVEILPEGEEGGS
jgi:hypothetical protein